MSEEPRRGFRAYSGKCQNSSFLIFPTEIICLKMPPIVFVGSFFIILAKDIKNHGKFGIISIFYEIFFHHNP